VNIKPFITLLIAVAFATAVVAAVPKLTSEGKTAIRADSTGAAPGATPTGKVSPGAKAKVRVQHTLDKATYAGLFLILVLSGLGLPLPEEIPLMMAGYLARHGTADLRLLIPIGIAGVLLADFILFAITRRWRNHIFRWRWVRTFIRPRHLTQARRQFNRHGVKIVVAARWLPALRSAVCITAGLMGISTLRFVLVDATAACITVPTSTVIGYLAAQHIDRLIAGVIRTENFALLGILLAVAGVVAFSCRRADTG